MWPFQGLKRKSCIKLVMTGLTAKLENQKIVDRLIHRHPPEGEIRVLGSSSTFATAYVTKKVAMAMAHENGIKTKSFWKRSKV